MEHDPVRKPAHYLHPSGIEVIDITKHETFLRGNILKYILRAPYKNRELEDLQKAQMYLEWEIARVKREQEDYLERQTGPTLIVAALGEDWDDEED